MYVCEHLQCKTWKWTYPLFTVVDDFALIMAKVTEVYLILVSWSLHTALGSMCHQLEQFSSTWSSEACDWEHNSPAHLGGKANQIKSGLMQYPVCYSVGWGMTAGGAGIWNETKLAPWDFNRQEKSLLMRSCWPSPSFSLYVFFFLKKL